MNDTRRDDLSALGQSRRKAMLGELVESMDTLHRRRRVRRRLGTGVGFGMAALSLMVFAGPSIFRSVPRRVAVVQPDPTPERSGPDLEVRPWHLGIEIIQTRPEIVAQYAPRLSTPIHVQHVSPRLTSTVEVIGDRKLLQMLALMDRPAGLVRAEGKGWLTAPVTDAELESARTTGGTGSTS